MIQLSEHECRILGVLIEKAQTTPGQYPMTLNALVSGANQKNNRDPIMNLNEDQVIAAVDGLRSKSLMREVSMSGSRVSKYRHVVRDVLDLGTCEMVILAELMMRGPQTVGELRNRGSRMHPLESMDVVHNVLKHLQQLDEPMVKEIPPAPGSRANRFAQLLCPTAHPLHLSSKSVVPAIESSSPPEDQGLLEQRIEKLEKEISTLREAVQQLATALGEPLPPST